MTGSSTLPSRSGAVLLLGTLAACGDNAAPIEIDSPFDTERVTFFGDVLALDDTLAMAPLADLPVCLDDTCATTDEDGVFVLDGVRGEERVVIAGEAELEVPTIVGVRGGPSLDRNLGSLIVLSRALIEAGAAAYQREPGLESGGVVLFVVQRLDVGEVQVAIGDTPAVYLGDTMQPDPGRPSLGAGGGAVFYAVPPGEATIRATAGSCEANIDGWPGVAPGELRVPVRAGHLTLVRPFCIGE